MLRDVLSFVLSRTDLTEAAALREINFAFAEIYANTELPNTVFELTVEPAVTDQRVSLPWYVGQILAVKKNCSRERIKLYDPRPFYQDQSYYQTPWTWRVLGQSSFNKSVTNATTLSLSISEAQSTRFSIALRGPTDNAQDTIERVVFDVGDTTHETTGRFTDAYITKDQITSANVVIKDSNQVEISIIPNSRYDGLNTIVQVLDRCLTSCQISDCNCFDILYKQVCPILYDPETYIPQQEVLMAKVMEWITLPKEGQDQKTALYSAKAKALSATFNHEDHAIEKKLDLARNQFATPYYWRI